MTDNKGEKTARKIVAKLDKVDAFIEHMDGNTLNNAGL